MSTIKVSEEIRHELEQFREYARCHEYTCGTIAGYCTHLSRFLRQMGIPAADALQSAIETFLEEENSNRPKTFKESRAALRLYFVMSVGGSLKKNSAGIAIPEIECLLQRFRVYSAEIKQIKAGTVDSEISHARGFLEYALVHNHQGFVDGMTARDVRDYVVERLARLADSSKGRHITSIRNFFRFRVFYGESVHPSVFKLPLSPAVWKKSAFPTTIDLDVFNALHEIPDSGTDIGKRNRCIILCFTELALRCSEVAALALDDFNWRGGYVTVRNTKNRSDRAIPLPEKLYQALAEYLAQARPQTQCRTLFVRFSHPRGEAMGISQIRGVVRRNGAKAGLADRASNTHILRRTAATRLYNAGNSLKLTADVLGHASLGSTTHYVKTDVAGLLTVASPWPGGARNA
jgi:site-specific recombinase XerD